MGAVGLWQTGPCDAPATFPCVKVTVIAAHPDDETIGAGGTIAKLIERGHLVECAILTAGADRPGTAAALGRRREAEAAAEILGMAPPRFCEAIDEWELHREGSWPVSMLVEWLHGSGGDPDLVLAPGPNELHWQHRLAFEAAAVYARPASRRRPISLLAYEVHRNPWWGGQSFRPQLLVDVSEHLPAKLAALAAYASERQGKGEQRSSEAVAAEARLLGMRAGLGAAEGFEVVRLYDWMLA